MNDNNTRPGDVTLPVKRTTGETIEERLTANAYHNILPARYQHKDENGEVVETQEELFERIPKNVAVPDIVYKANQMGITVEVTPEQIQPRRNESDRQDVAEEVFGEGTSIDDDVTTELTEYNAWAFAYDTVVPELENDDLREHVESIYEQYYEQISNLKFTPNSPTWMGAGNEIQQLSACFVNSPEDDMTDIHETAKEAALTFQSGGGVGYDFSQLRPYGDPVGSTGGISSGPITFMETFDQVCGTIAQGGTRRGAQMGVMHVWHPDIIQFIHAKNKDVSLAHTLKLNDPDDFTHNSFAEALEEARDLIGEDGKVPEFLRNAVEGHLSNFNISVGITDDFMDALENDEMFTLKNPRTDEPHIATEETKELYEQFGLGEYVTVGEVLEIPAGEIWGRIVDGAYENGEPGVVYIERMNKTHSFDTEKYPEHQINATNPCGEQELEEYESCNLGHINLSTLVAEQNGSNPDFRAFMKDKGVDPDTLTEEEAQPYVEEFLEMAVNWDDMDERITSGIRFLDNVITMSDFPVEKYNEKVMGNRKVGLGIMGLAQMFIQMGVKYGSPVANEITRQVMTYINHEGKQVSADLADERGVFDEWDKSKYANPTEYPDWFEHHTGLEPEEYADGFELRNHDVTTIAPTGCVDESSLVTTDSGLREIQDLDNTEAEFEQWGEIEVGVATDGGVKEATAVYDNGFTNVKTLSTNLGASVSATPNHRFRTFENGNYVWKEAGDFAPGDDIVLHRGGFEGSDAVVLDTSERDNSHHNTNTDLILPGIMSGELAEFLGYYVGDGYTHDDVGVKLTMSSDNEERIQYLSDLGESVFGVSPARENRDGRTILSFGGRHLPRYFTDNGWDKETGNDGTGAANAEIPSEILEADAEILRRFMSGLFEADGSASRKVEFYTASERLSEQVQTALLSLGHVFHREMKTADELGDGHFGDRDMYRLRGANKNEDVKFMDEIGMITKSLNSMETTQQSGTVDTYPSEFVSHVRAVDGYENVPTKIKRRVNQSIGSQNGSLSRQTVRAVEEITGETVTVDGRPLTDFVVTTVESVEDDMAYTKDISVPDNNTYLANGFVTHNTTSMVGNTSGGCEPLYNVAYYKNVSQDVQGDEMLVEFDDYFLRTLEANDIDVEAVKREAQELMENNEFDGAESLETVPDAISELFIVTGELTAKEHAGVQCAAQDGVDASISKTTNAANDSTREDADEVFRYIYENGGKGVTYYRDGTRSKQVLTTRAQNTEFSDMDDDEAAEFIREKIEDVFGDVETFVGEQFDGRSVIETAEQTAQTDLDVESVLDTQDGFITVRDRPDELHGVTQRIQTGYGKVYVTINVDSNGNPFELIANIGNSGGYTNSFTESLAKTCSIALRSGVDPEEIVTELRGTRSPKVAWHNSEQIQSIPDAIGYALMKVIEGEVTSRRSEGVDTDVSAVKAKRSDETSDGDDTQSLIDSGESPECPSCGSISLYYSEGCKTCESCGWSEC